MKNFLRIGLIYASISASAFAQTSDSMKNIAAIQQALIEELRANQTPSGSIMPYAGDQAPQGWSLCDGSLVETKKYPKLFAVIGYKFGGSGSTFALPDLRDEFLRGASSSRAVGSRQNFATAKGGLVAETVLTKDLRVSTSGEYQTGFPTGHFDNRDWVLKLDGGGWARSVLVGQGGDQLGKPYYLTVTTAGTANGGSWSTTINSTDTETRPRNMAVNYIIKL